MKFLTILVVLATMLPVAGVQAQTDYGPAIRLGSIAGAEELCGLRYDPAKLAAVTQSLIPADDEYLWSALQEAMSGMAQTFADMGGAEKVVWCAHMASGAEAFGFLEPGSGQDFAAILGEPPAGSPAPGQKSKTAAGMLSCAFRIDRIVKTTGERQYIGDGVFSVHNGVISNFIGGWETGVVDRKAPFAGADLRITSAGALRGTLPVYLLFAEAGKPAEPAIPVRIQSEPGVLSDLAVGGEVGFEVDHFFDGALTVENCAP